MKHPRTAPNSMMLFLAILTLLAAVMIPPSNHRHAFGIGVASAFTTTTNTVHSRIRTTTGSSIERRAAASSASSSASSSSSEIDENDCWTLQELEDYASDPSVNVIISFTTFGPGYRAVARAKHDESIVLGYVEGFLRPTQPKLLHVDKMEIFQPVLKRVKRSHPNTLNFGGVTIGLGLLMGYRCLLYASESAQGPREVAEFLAIDDEEFQHKRLVRYYKYAGFQFVKYVGDDFQDIPDRMVWGGCGTLMKQDISVLMAKWTSLFKLMKKRANKEDEKRAAATKITSSEREGDEQEEEK